MSAKDVSGPPWIMGRDQDGNTYHDLGPHPRAGLLNKFAASHAEPIYENKLNGARVLVGYKVEDRWVTFYNVTPYEIPDDPTIRTNADLMVEVRDHLYRLFADVVKARLIRKKLTDDDREDVIRQATDDLVIRFDRWLCQIDAQWRVSRETPNQSERTPAAGDSSGAAQAQA